MEAIESAGMTDIGKKRKENEDALLIDDNMGLYVVADGVGGHRAGKVASHMVVETMAQTIQSLCDTDNEEEPVNHDPTLSESANRLISAIQFSNQRVYNSGNTNKDCQGMCSTVSTVYFTDETLIAANVGDSPIYLVRNGNIDLLSTPHTVLDEQAFPASDGMDHKVHQFKNVLTRAMGIDETVKADVCEIQCFAKDIVVLCSDGLSQSLQLDEISAITMKNPPGKACRSLIDLANKRGGNDNITVIVLKLNKSRKRGKKTGRFLPRILGKSVP